MNAQLLRALRNFFTNILFWHRYFEYIWNNVSFNVSIWKERNVDYLQGCYNITYHKTWALNTASVYRRHADITDATELQT